MAQLPFVCPKCHLGAPDPIRPPLWPQLVVLKVPGAAAIVCFSLPLVLWKKVLQQFQTVYDVVMPHHGAIAIWLSQVLLWRS